MFGRAEGFYNSYVSSPFRDADGGSRFNNLLWLFLISKIMRPSLVVDSGTFKGASAWALKMGAGDAQVHSFDPNMSNRILRDERIQFHESDWTAFDYGEVDPELSLCYFDDHLDQVRRLVEAHDRGFKYLIFDDDLNVSNMPRMVRSGHSLPKLQFIYDDSLVHGQEINWLSVGSPRSFKIDRRCLDDARRRIQAMQKIPNIWMHSCVPHQNPYTLVVLR